MKQLESRTFGDTPAAIRLTQLINEKGIHQRDISKIGKSLSTFSRVLNELEKTDTRIRIGVAHIMYIYYRELYNIKAKFNSFAFKLAQP